MGIIEINKLRRGGKGMEKSNIITVFENHLKVLEDAAKQQCSGEELKAITEAMKITANTIEYFGFEHCSSEGKCMTNPLSEN